uniref:Uncharacterized protein n=1 Tax=Arundo donax TaxID=35708 RepID=A0A0A9BI51_ARUDO
MRWRSNSMFTDRLQIQGRLHFRQQLLQRPANVHIPANQAGA